MRECREILRAIILQDVVFACVCNISYYIVKNVFACDCSFENECLKNIQNFISNCLASIGFLIHSPEVVQLAGTDSAEVNVKLEDNVMIEAARKRDFLEMNVRCSAYHRSDLEHTFFQTYFQKCAAKFQQFFHTNRI